MLERRINLEEILLSKFNFTDIMEKAMALQAMKEAVRRALELAAENAKGKPFPMNEIGVIRYAEVNKQSILDTIKQVE